MPPTSNAKLSRCLTKSSVELLANYTTPEQMLAVDSQTLAAVIFSEIGGDIKKFDSVP